MQMTCIEKSYEKRATCEHGVLLGCVMIIELRLSQRQFIFAAERDRRKINPGYVRA